MSQALLEIKGLDAFYGATQILHGVGLSVAPKGITTILGANGAGKTSTLRAISGLVRTKGEIWFDGRRIDGLPTEKVARMGVAHVPDGRGTLVNMSVQENLLVGAYLQRDRAVAEATMERMFGYFPRLRERRRQQAGTLSGGEQQMLAIARALMQAPKLLLLDEPSFGLAPVIIREIFSIMHTINEKEGVGILLVEQNVSRALDLADSANLLETGRLVMSGTAKQMRENDQVRRSYLGF